MVVPQLDPRPDLQPADVSHRIGLVAQSEQGIGAHSSFVPQHASNRTPERSHLTRSHSRDLRGIGLLRYNNGLHEVSPPRSTMKPANASSFGFCSFDPGTALQVTLPSTVGKICSKINSLVHNVQDNIDTLERRSNYVLGPIAVGQELAFGRDDKPSRR